MPSGASEGFLLCLISSLSDPLCSGKSGVFFANILRQDLLNKPLFGGVDLFKHGGNDWRSAQDGTLDICSAHDTTGP